MKKILLATPRGFCAGVDRAIHIVEKAIEKYGAPIFVRHEIVHNQFVVSNLKKLGVIFVEDLSEVPEKATVIFSAHGVPESVYQEALRRGLKILDATCPLVKKVHSSAKRHYDAGRHVILIGHSGHAEVEGTLGQLPEGAISVVRNKEDIQNLSISNEIPLAYITQTTLSVAETKQIIEALKLKYPHIIGPEAGDLCYATGNRQKAVSQLSSEVDLLLVVGSKNSSNSSRLCELGLEKGIPSHLIDSVNDIKQEWFKGIETVGVSSGASAPEVLVQEVIHWIKDHFKDIELENRVTLVENTKFNLPKELQD